MQTRERLSANAFEQYRIKTYQEAGYKPYIIAAMMFANRFENPFGGSEKYPGKE
ncbi:MAG: hypothetical protein MZV64_25690 [Ignavibacteriales bacterium]|nr:hypothetical protein [Ignavibacteriales bacterium]